MGTRIFGSKLQTSDLVGKILALFILQGVVSFLHAEPVQLKIIPLKHRLASDVVPILKPLVTEGGSISGMSNQLIIRTTPKNLQALLKTLKAIDRPLQSLKISVRYDTHGKSQGREQGADGYYQNENIRIETRNPGTYKSDGQTVTIQRKNGEIRYRSWSTQSETDDNRVYFVRTVEGQPAWIRLGESVPVPERTIILHPYGAADIYDTVSYRDISSGFYVIPHLNGDRVTLMISPQRSRAGHSYGFIETQEAEMTVSGSLGQWIDLGGITEQYKEQTEEGLYQTHHYGQSRNHIFVKVEAID